MTELFSNLGQTTINQVGGIGATDTSVTVAALNGTNPANAFPSSGNFRIVLGTDASSEITLCTAVDPVNKILTIVRGQEGTLAKSWPNGTAVTISVTAQAVNQMRADLFSVGPFANRPAQGLPTGSYYQTTDGFTPWIWDASMGQWRPQINGVMGIQPPPASTFNTVVNSASQTIVDGGKGTLLYTGNSDASNTVNFRGFDFAPPGGVGFAEVAFSYDGAQVQAASTWWETGPYFRLSTTGQMYIPCMSVNLSGGQFYTSLNIYSNASTRTSFTGYNSSWSDPNSPLFIRVRKDNVNVYAESSRNRINWTILNTSTIASVFSAPPDRIGFGGFSAGGASVCRIFHYNYGPNPVVADSIFTPNVHNLRSQVFVPNPNPPPVSLPVGWTTPILNR